MTNPYTTDVRFKNLYDGLGSRGLRAPEGSLTTRNGQPLWTETLVIDSLTQDSPGVKQPEQPGDETFVLVLKTHISQESAQGVSLNPNAGKPFTAWLRFNMTALTRSLGSGRESGQAIMTRMSLQRLKELLSACGLDVELGMDPQAFADSEDVDNLIGVAVNATLTQKEGDRGKQDEVRNFFEVSGA